MHDLTGFQRDCLLVLNGLDEPNGTELQTELEGYYDEEVFGGHLYPVLNGLSKRGFVDKTERNGRSHEYDLTEEGVAVVKARLDWERQRYPGNP